MRLRTLPKVQFLHFEIALCTELFGRYFKEQNGVLTIF